jgi:hypothetical protein
MAQRFSRREGVRVFPFDFSVWMLLVALFASSGAVLARPACNVQRVIRFHVGAHRTRADFRKALRNAALSLHPDRNPGCSELATRAFMEFQGAISALEREHENEMLRRTRRARNVSITRTVMFVGSVVAALVVAVGALVAVVLG